MTPRIALRTLAGALLAACAVAGPAQAAGGITPLSPKKGAKVAVGQSPTFKMRVKGPGSVWVTICDSKKKDSKGVICTKAASEKASLGQAKKKQGVFQFTPEFFDFETFWMNTPGTYYWQAYRINCDNGPSDCQQESAITRFKVG